MEEALAWGKKNAATQGRTIVFVDESGLSERPTRVRTWAPRGQTPVLQYHFNWHQLSVMAGLSVRRFYFRLFPGAIRGPQVIEFLKALRTQLRRPLLVLWDGLPAHRSRLVRDYLESLDGAIQIERLPAYAPELNPVEYLWAYLKQHELPHFCAEDFAHLTTVARRRLASMQRRTTLVVHSGNKLSCLSGNFTNYARLNKYIRGVSFQPNRVHLLRNVGLVAAFPSILA